MVFGATLLRGLVSRQLGVLCCRALSVEMAATPAACEVSVIKRVSEVTPVPLEEEVEAKRPRLETEATFDWSKKRKVALLLAYSGLGYSGMQRNPGTKTIEEDLLAGLQRAGLISEEQYRQPQQVHFQRAARTDKNVSAVRQVVSLKMPAEGPVLERVNCELPDSIRLLGLCRVTKNFNSKGNCDARTYSYTLPTLALAPNGSVEPVGEEYRASPEVLQRTADTLRLFEGTHNFHNFTSKKYHQDPSAKRYIMKFECGEPFLAEGMQFLELRVKGQSFMLHQIRKMVGVAIAIVQGLTGPDVIERAWQPQRLDLPVAPGLGLVLEEVHYDKYDRKYGGDGMHETLTWSGCEAAILDFKSKFILPTIIRGERDEKSMVEWLQTLPMHSYAVRERPHVSEQTNQARDPADPEVTDPEVTEVTEVTDPKEEGPQHNGASPKI